MTNQLTIGHFQIGSSESRWSKRSKRKNWKGNWILFFGKVYSDKQCIDSTRPEWVRECGSIQHSFFCRFVCVFTLTSYTILRCIFCYKFEFHWWKLVSSAMLIAIMWFKKADMQQDWYHALKYLVCLSLLCFLILFHSSIKYSLR